MSVELELRQTIMSEELKNLALSAHKAIETCRRIAAGLSHVSEVNGGLIRALDMLVRRPWPQLSPSMTFRSDVYGESRVPVEDLEHLYRIAQEAVANAIKHAKANSIDVRARIDQKKIVLRIADDGIGLPGGQAPSTGLGLKIMRHRAELIRATLKMESGREGGTVVSVSCCQPAMSSATTET